MAAGDWNDPIPLSIGDSAIDLSGDLTYRPVGSANNIGAGTYDPDSDGQATYFSFNTNPTGAGSWTFTVAFASGFDLDIAVGALDATGDATIAPDFKGISGAANSEVLSVDLAADTSYYLAVAQFEADSAADYTGNAASLTITPPATYAPTITAALQFQSGVPTLTATGLITHQGAIEFQSGVPSVAVGTFLIVYAGIEFATGSPSVAVDTFVTVKTFTEVRAGPAVYSVLPRVVPETEFRVVPDQVVYRGRAVDIEVPRVADERAGGTYSVTGLPAGLTFDATTRRITGTTSAAAGEIDVTVQYSA